MNCQSHLGRLFLSSCREGANEFKTADKEGGGTCWISVSGRSKELYTLSNGCSISSDNSWDPIGAEKWNEVWLHVQIAALVRAGIIREELLLELRPLHYWSSLVGTKSVILSHPEVKAEGQCDWHAEGSFCYSFKGLAHQNHDTGMFKLTTTTHMNKILNRFSVGPHSFNAYKQRFEVTNDGWMIRRETSSINMIFTTE